MTPAPGKTTGTELEDFFVVDLMSLTSSDLTLSTVLVFFKGCAAVERVAILEIFTYRGAASDNKG